MKYAIYLLCITFIFSIHAKSINFLVLSNKNEECLYNYDKFVKNKIEKNTNFDEYLEYWWDLEESDDNLLNRICKYIEDKYIKSRYLKKKI